MYKIYDWMGNKVNNLTFKTFEDGWDWIMANIPDEDHAYDDLFVEVS